MVLSVALGFAVQHFLGWSLGPLVGVLAGIVFANLLPGKSRCQVDSTGPAESEHAASDEREG